MKYRLQDLIDIQHFQNLQDRLNEIYSFPSAIIDNDGTILTATAWQDVCTKFHRQNSECERECIKSDQYILSHIEEADPAVSYLCPHGLVDNATPIIVDGVHLGNFFTGQFFLEKPDLNFFRSQAQRYGFVEEAYLDAVKKVPVWTRAQLDSYLSFIKGLIEVISETGLKNLRAIEARQKAEESEKQFQAMFDLASIGIAQTDPHSGKWMRVNQKMCDITGYTAEELLSLRVSDITHPEDRENDSKAFQRVIRGDAPDYRIEKRYIRKNGAVVWVNVNMTVIRDDSGQPTRTMATVEDITGRKETVEALRESEQRYRSLFDGMMNGLAYCRMIYEEGRPCDFVYLSVNEAFETLTGLKDVAGKKVSEVIPGIRESDPRLIATYGRVASTGVPERFEIHLNTLSMWFEISAYSPRRDHFVAVFDVITERKRIEKALRESEERMQFAFMASHTGAWDLDLENHTAFRTIEHDRIFGYEELLPQWTYEMFLEHVVPEDRAEVDLKFQEAMQTQGNWDFECRIVRRDGERRWIWACGQHRRNEQGTPRRLVGIVQDITERRQAELDTARLEVQLQQAQRLESVGRLAGGVAHDFNNMLGVILGHADIALEQVEPEQPLHEDLEEIRKAAERSADLTRQLLTFARRQLISPKVLDLNEVVAGTLKMLQRLLGEDIHLEWHPSANPVTVKVDPSQIDHILANLCVNARDAIADVGKITIETGEKAFDAKYCADHAGFVAGEYVMLAVSDDGSGMDKETLASIFEPFFTTKPVGQGTGLGLATVYGAVRQNNGFINVYSEPGEGTTFSIYLPRYAGDDKAAGTHNAFAPDPRGNETILVTEDEPSVLNLTTKLLEGLGYTVLAARTPDAAILAAREHPGEIHLLITDVVMPEMNGRALANQLSSVRPRLKHLFMSGYTANVIAHHGVLDDGVHFIQKPFSATDLARRVREALDGE